MPVEQALHTILNANMLPLAKARNLVDAHRTFQEDEELQQVLADGQRGAREYVSQRGCVREPSPH